MRTLSSALALLLGSLPIMGTAVHELHHAADTCGTAGEASCAHFVLGSHAGARVAAVCAQSSPSTPRPCDGCSFCRIAPREARPLVKSGSGPVVPAPAALAVPAPRPVAPLPRSFRASKIRGAPPTDLHPVVLPLRN